MTDSLFQTTCGILIIDEYCTNYVHIDEVEE